jgi:hypothetical protein
MGRLAPKGFWSVPVAVALVVAGLAAVVSGAPPSAAQDATRGRRC